MNILNARATIIALLTCIPRRTRASGLGTCCRSMTMIHHQGLEFFEDLDVIVTLRITSSLIYSLLVVINT